MAWLENIDSEMIITCGDGRQYKPSWIRSTVEKEFNSSKFEFLEVPGSLLRRYKPMGAKYDIRICFQGEDHLNEVDRFLVSADDPRPWTIQHPLYGLVTLQPLSLKRDDTSINVTEISGPFIETITEENPRVSISKPTKIISDKATLDEVIGNYYVRSLSPSSQIVNPFVPPTRVIAVQRENINLVYNSIARKVKGATDSVKDVLDADRYFNLFNSANGKMLQLTSLPLEAAQAVITFINAPFQFKNSVVSRVNSLIESFEMVKKSVVGLTSAENSVVEKKVYETNAALIISSMATASVLQYDQANDELTDSPDTQNFVTPDYPSRTVVVGVMTQLLDTYNEYLNTLDELQTENGANEGSFIPDPTIAEQLSALINFTVSELQNIVLTGRQERIISLAEDTNVINLTHKLYGLDDEDVRLHQLIDTNRIGINELLKLGKGRQIVYYV